MRSRRRTTAADTRMPPSRSELIEFFRMKRRERVPLDQLARLLAAPADRVRAVVESEGLPLQSDSIEWVEAAAYLFDAWPRAQIIDTLPRDLARRIPTAFHPVH